MTQALLNNLTNTTTEGMYSSANSVDVQSSDFENIFNEQTKSTTSEADAAIFDEQEDEVIDITTILETGIEQIAEMPIAEETTTQTNEELSDTTEENDTITEEDPTMQKELTPENPMAALMLQSQIVQPKQHSNTNETTVSNDEKLIVMKESDFAKTTSELNSKQLENHIKELETEMIELKNITKAYRKNSRTPQNV